jgi:hypothetical protein
VNTPISLTLSPDIPALASPATHRLTTRDAQGYANAGCAVSVRHDATAAQIRDVIGWLNIMAEGRA